MTWLLCLLGVVLLPNWLLLVCGVPLGRLYPTPLLSFGDADIRVYDVLILIITLKVGLYIAASKRVVHATLYRPIGTFLAVLLGAIFISYYRFGASFFAQELVAFVRFLVLFIVFFLTTHAIVTVRQLALANKGLDLFGYVVAASVYVGLALFTVGIDFGEVSPYGMRTFGILGDQVGFLLPLFLFKELLRYKMVRASFFGVAILLTGTRGALIASGVGAVCVYLLSAQNRGSWRHPYSMSVSAVLVITVVAVAFGLDLGSMRTRFGDAEMFDLGLTTRGTTFVVAVKVFMDNLLTGVGFSGFRLVAAHYGAEAIFAQKLYYSPALVATTANQYLQVATDAGILGLIVFLWMMKRSLQVLKLAQSAVTVELQCFFKAAYIWLWSLLLGAQSIAWLLPDMTLSYVLWIVLGIAIAAISIQYAVVQPEIPLTS